MNIGKEILNLRAEHKMTQEEFGKIFHVTRQTVSNWENEKSYPDLKILVGISDRFDISLDKLIKEDTQMVQTIDKERMKHRFQNRFAVGVMIFFFVVSLIFRERNIYTQGAWVLFVMTFAVNVGFALQDKPGKWKYLAFIILYTVLLVLGLGGEKIG